jgi:hypothetical protein
MLLILSARTVGEDIAGQFGRLPPSFLPMGSKRLFTLQAEAARGEPCFMTLPEDIELPAADLRAIEAAGISVIRQSQRLPLTRAIGEALIQARAQGPVRVLYGDTMVRMPAGGEERRQLSVGVPRPRRRAGRAVLGRPAAAARQPPRGLRLLSFLGPRSAGRGLP